MENNPSSIPKPIRCKAAVSRAPGEPLRIEEVVVAPPQAYEVRIKILCTSVCHTDVTFWRMKGFPAVLPQIYGHEAVGVVESVGEHVEEVGVGDMVLPTFLAQCGECRECESERSNICGKLTTRAVGMPRDGTTRFTDAEGAVVHGFLGGAASFSEYTVADVAHVVKVDPAVPPEKACLLCCGVSTGVGAAWKVANVEAGSTVAIFGLGAVGLAVIAKLN